MRRTDILDPLTKNIIRCIITVHRVLGPGFIESIYRRALVIEFENQGLRVEAEKRVLIHYENRVVGQHRLDLVIADKVVVELKAVRKLHPVHYSQLRSYLKAARLRTGLLVNFSTERADYRRISITLD